MPELAADLETVKESRFTEVFNVLTASSCSNEAQVAVLRLLVRPYFDAGFELGLDAARKRLIDVVAELQQAQEK